ncbi:uncharacterized protein LOC144016093 [Festucalex cinctus]
MLATFERRFPQTSRKAAGEDLLHHVQPPLGSIQQHLQERTLDFCLSHNPQLNQEKPNPLSQVQHIVKLVRLSEGGVGRSPVISSWGSYGCLIGMLEQGRAVSAQPGDLYVTIALCVRPLSDDECGGLYHHSSLQHEESILQTEGGRT